jgi:pyruvate/2-oxoglutarate dehydrogenase complex dihydrolipoamide dehydrogenase (E3) component
VVVVGGSYVGLEFAQIYRRFEAQVTVVEMAHRLIQREDPNISAAVQAILEAEDIQVVRDRAGELPATESSMNLSSLPPPPG